MEQDDEKIVDWVRQMMIGIEEDETRYENGVKAKRDVILTDSSYRAALERIQAEAKGSSSKYSNIFMSEYTTLFLVKLLRASSHFRLEPYFKLVWLTKNMANVHGGVSSTQ